MGRYNIVHNSIYMVILPRKMIFLKTKQCNVQISIFKNENSLAFVIFILGIFNGRKCTHCKPKAN